MVKWVPAVLGTRHTRGLVRFDDCAVLLLVLWVEEREDEDSSGGR